MKLLKHIIRQRIREKRTQLPEGLRHHFSVLITRQLVKNSFFRSARTIALYASTMGEVSTDLLFEYAMNHQKICYLPVLREKSLAFVNVDRHSVFKQNRFGILEPTYHEAKTIQASHLDLVIVPLVAFDIHGHRLGMGGGFYDRTFAFKRKGTRKPKLVGVAYDFQRISHVPRSHLDVLLDRVVTEKKNYPI